MKNSEFKIGSHILVQGNKGIVEEITNLKEYKVDYKGKALVGNGYGCSVLSEDAVNDMLKKGYTCLPTGRTATYFKVSFDNEESLKHTAYNHGLYGCNDDFESYGSW